MLVVLFAVLAAAHPYAQSYPARPIKLVVPQAPGGHSDAIGRIVGPKLAEILQQPVVIDNRGGAGGTIGAEAVARAPRDGYTLLLGGSNSLAIAAAMAGDVRYDPLRDFVPIGGMATVPYALAVRAGVPAETLRELLAYARANPGRLNYGSSGVGSTSSLAVEWIKSAAVVDIVHVPYRVTSQALFALLNGQIDIVVTDLSLLVPHAKAGTLRILAVASARRSAAAPDLPTVAEEGIDGYAVDAWYGLVAPAGTPAEVVAKLSAGLSEALRSPEVRQKFDESGYEPMIDTPKAFGEYIRSDIERYSTVIKRAGLRATP
jgi:tripartite-type tricarboxylate transporter receptor subunit TctC